MKRFDLKRDGLPIIFVLGCFVLGWYNLKNNDDFFKTSFSTIISVAIAVVLSYYFVQRKNDERRKKEKIDKLLYKIQEMIADEEFISVESEGIIRKNLIYHRSIGNKIQYLNENTSGDIHENVQKVSETFEQLREFYSNHYSDKDYVSRSDKEIANYKTKIDDTCDKIHMMLM